MTVIAPSTAKSHLHPEKLAVLICVRPKARTPPKALDRALKAKMKEDL